MLEPAFTYRNSTQIILVSNQNQICGDLNPTWLACVLKAGAGFLWRKEKYQGYVHTSGERPGEIPLALSIKTNPKN